MSETKDSKANELPMPLAKRGRGRPPTFAAKSNAERQKTYREKKRMARSNASNDNVTENSLQFFNDQTETKAKSEVALLQDKVAVLERENSFLTQECRDARARIEKMQADRLSTARLTSPTQPNWEQRSLTLQHELDIVKLLLKEQTRTTERLQSETQPLRQELAKLRANAKRTATNNVKLQDLRDRNETLHSQVMFLTSEMERLRKIS